MSSKLRSWALPTCILLFLSYLIDIRSFLVNKSKPRVYQTTGFWLPRCFKFVWIYIYLMWIWIDLYLLLLILGGIGLTYRDFQSLFYALYIFSYSEIVCLSLLILWAPWAQDPGPRSDGWSDGRTVGRIGRMGRIGQELLNGGLAKRGEGFMFCLVSQYIILYECNKVV